MGAEALIVAAVLERAIKMTRKLQKMQGNTAAVEAASAVMAAAVTAGSRLTWETLQATLPYLTIKRPHRAAAEAEAEAAVLGRPI
jgi:hypothetical protein